jgi:hypothetical protein
MSTRTRWLVGAAVCVVAVIAGATVVRMTEQEEFTLMCNSFGQERGGAAGAVSS